MVKPGYYRHEIYQGERYSVTLTLNDPEGSAIDTTDWTAASQVRTLDDALAASFTCTFPELGKLKLELLEAVTADLSPRRYLHDLRCLDASGAPAYQVAGDAIVHKRVTVPS